MDAEVDEHDVENGPEGDLADDERWRVLEMQWREREAVLIAERDALKADLASMHVQLTPNKKRSL